MKHFPVGPVRRAAFTIIELLTVITIILILAGLILGIAGNAQNKAARSRAEGEIKGMETACNNYQIDNGTYPRTTDTDGIDAQKNWDPSNALYTKASMALYQMISGGYYYDSTSASYKPWSSSSTVPKPTVYFPFKDSQLQNKNSVTSGYIDPSTVTAILDPFGFSYGYSTAYAADAAANAASGTNTTPTRGYNPTFDLWSTAGYSATSGKPYPTKGGITTATYNTLWVKNW